MRYPDLVARTTALPEGTHKIYSLDDTFVAVVNTGRRHPLLSAHPEYRLKLHVYGRDLAPRHADFFSDYLLKLEVHPDLRLALTEACEMVCNGADPDETITSKRLPAHFAEASDANWSLQTSMYQTGGLPTSILVHGLQALIRVYDLNDPQMKAPEAFRKVFLALDKGTPLRDAVQPLQPKVLSGKRYFDRLVR